MPVSSDAIRSSLSDLLQPGQIQELKESHGKILVTVAVDVPMAEKPAFADQVKRRVKTVEGVQEVYVSFAPVAEKPEPPGPQPMENVDRIIAIGAGKGGVGKSTVAVNLAVALAGKGHSVGLLDADIYGPSAALMTGTADHKASGDAQQRIVPAVRHGIKIISIAFLLPEDQSAVVWRGPMVGKMVTQLLHGVAWGQLDYLIVDLPPGTGDAVLSLSQTVPLSGAIVVTTPQDVALLDVLKAVEMFHAVRVPVVGVVENMAGFTCPKCGETTPIFLEGAGRKAAARCSIPLLGSLPLDAEIPPGGDSGTPIVVARPESPSSRVFEKIAEATHERLAQLADQAAPQFGLDWASK